FFLVIVLYVGFIYFGLCNSFFNLNKRCIHFSTFTGNRALFSRFTIGKHSRALSSTLSIYSIGLKYQSKRFLSTTSETSADTPNPKSLDSPSDQDFAE